MADDFEPHSSCNSGRNKQAAFFCCKSDAMSANASSSFSGKDDHEQQTSKSLFYASDLKMNYFAAPSKYQQEMLDPIVVNDAPFEVDRKVESPILVNPEYDWVEPCTPIRSCIIGTSEEDDNSSRSCSIDSSEGYVLKEKDVDPYIGDYSTVLHEPIDALQEVHTNAKGVIDDGGEGNKSLWRPYLNAWLSEAGQSITFCSIALAAAIIGLALAGTGWHRVRLEFQKLRCRFFFNRKGISQLMYQLVQIKSSSSKVRRIPVIRAENPLLNL